MLADRVERLILWGRTPEKAAACARRLGLPATVETRGFGIDELTRLLAAGDVVISMLPATEHTTLLRTCIARGAHFACTSYTSEQLNALSIVARDAGTVVLTEAGLDPGVDHLLAHVLLARAREELGDGSASVSLTSYCGGVPAIPNEFRYRFSWAPRGVLTALLSPARYVESCTVKTAERPWESVRSHFVGSEEFEAYPNRDSVPCIQQYRIPADWQIETFVRGTLRLPGWKAAWAEVFASLKNHGLACVDELAADLARRYPTGDSDRDRVVLAVELDVRTVDGRTWSGRQVLDLIGDDAETAMARCVSVPLAFGVSRILDGGLPAGLNRAGETAEEAQLWLDELERHGITPQVNVVGANVIPTVSAVAGEIVTHPRTARVVR
jgi:hypothetical protein